MNQPILKRRQFLASGAALAVPTIIPRHVLGAPGRPGANDRIMTAVIGTGNRVTGILPAAPKDIQLIALADCDRSRMQPGTPFARAAEPLCTGGFEKLTRYQDFRQMLDKQPALDAVFVTTTTHARAHCVIHALQAGLDVYCEKPMALTVEEGRAIVRAARKHERVVQIGTQAASFPNNKRGAELVRGGQLGAVEKAVTVNFAPGLEWTEKPGQPVPDGLDWNLWLNQAPRTPYSGKDFHPGCERWGRWTLFDNGGQSWGMSGWGTHSLEQAQRGLGLEETGPTEIILAKPGDPASPVTLVYADGKRIEMKIPVNSGPAWGAIFVGEKGKIEINRWKVVSNPPELTKDLEDVEARQHATPWHVQNWVDCMRSRKRPNADVEAGHRATTLCCIASVARELGRNLKWDPVHEQFIDDEQANANRWMTRRRRNEFKLPAI